jgi:hypothetical protein
MSAKSRRVKRAVLPNGRSKHGDGFVKLENWVLDTPAFRDLKALPRAVYVLLRRRFNGLNNGHIYLSVRTVADELKCSKDTASRAFKTLEERGFIRSAQKGSFHWKSGNASTWILTEEPFNGEPATKDFARWQPQKSESGPTGRTDGPKQGTNGISLVANKQASVPAGGPESKNEPRSRSLPSDTSNIPEEGDDGSC